MNSTAHTVRQPAAKAAVPPLRNGDHLTVKEFLRRYEAMPHVKKAELIEGVVYMGSPVSAGHGKPHGILAAWLGLYFMGTPGTEMLPGTTVLLDVGENCPQPDLCLRIAPEADGQSKTNKAGYVEGAPELATEVSATTVNMDRGKKFDAYCRNGVKEYIVWRTDDEIIDWFILRSEEFRPLRPKAGIHRSKVFPGLWLDAAAMIAGDLARVRDVVDQGIASDEHRRFVARLAKKRR